MLICIAGKIFSYKNEFAGELCKKASLELILYDGDHFEIDGYDSISIVRVKDRNELDQYALHNNSQVQVFVIREASDWEFLCQRLCRTLIMVETPTNIRLEKILSLSESKMIAIELPGMFYNLISRQVDELFASLNDKFVLWLLLNDIFDFYSMEKICKSSAPVKEINSSNGVFDLKKLLETPLENYLYKNKKETAYSDLKRYGCTTVYISKKTELNEKSVYNLIKKVYHTRDSWDEYFLGLVKLTASNSTCIKMSGCVLVDEDKRIIAVGHSGTPTKSKNCIDGGCLKCTPYYATCYTPDSCFCIHAIQSAILYIGRRQLRNNCTLYCLSYPCISCSKVISQSKIKRVVYCIPAPEDPLLKNDLLETAGIQLEYVKVSRVRVYQLDDTN